MIYKLSLIQNLSYNVSLNVYSRERPDFQRDVFPPGLQTTDFFIFFLTPMRAKGFTVSVLLARSS
jgi:hypothetical protein